MGPTASHAQFGVRIQLKDEKDENDGLQSVMIASRVLDKVAKDLLVVIVDMGPNTSLSATSSSDKIADYTDWSLKELVLSRWQPSSLSRAQ